MAGGWARDGAVQDQIDDTIKDAVLGARARLPAGEGAEYCDDCGELIPERRREALPGTRTCVACQSERDAEARRSGRGSTGAGARTASCDEDRSEGGPGAALFPLPGREGLGVGRRA